MNEALTLLENKVSLQKWRQEARQQQLTVGLVATMGNLHPGHISLVEAAKNTNDLVIATIFVNPLQFGPGEDLARYPRTFAEDCSALQAAGCDALLTPDTAMLYPDGLQAQTSVSVPVLSTLLCGKSRPGHFDGVCTIVCKLFNLIQPDHAWFGMKDYQQYTIISRMVKDLNMNIRLTGMPVIREPDGLAMSSRNGYLTPDQRQVAPELYKILQQSAAAVHDKQPFRKVEVHAEQALRKIGFMPDYVSICIRQTLLPAMDATQPLVILAAASLGTTRLIDNLEISIT